MWGDTQGCLACMCAGGGSEDKQGSLHFILKFSQQISCWADVFFVLLWRLHCSVFVYYMFSLCIGSVHDFSLDSLWCWLFFFLFILDLFIFFLLVKDLKVWRTDPGSIFDIDPLEDNIQSRSLHMLSGTACMLSSSPLHGFVLKVELLGTVEVHCVMYILKLRNQKTKKVLGCFKIPLIIYVRKKGF